MSLTAAESRLAEIQDSVGYSSDDHVPASTFIQLCDLLRSVLWAVQRDIESVRTDSWCDCPSCIDKRRS